MNFSPSVIAPIVAVIAMSIQLIFGVELNDEIQSNIVTNIINVSALAAVVYGIFKNHQK